MVGIRNKARNRFRDNLLRMTIEGMDVIHVWIGHEKERRMMMMMMMLSSLCRACSERGEKRERLKSAFRLGEGNRELARRRDKTPLLNL